jgi:hypothetical protein
MNRNIMRRVGVAASSAVLSAGLVLTAGYTAFADVGHGTGTAITSTSIGNVSNMGTHPDNDNGQALGKGQALRHYVGQTTTTDIADQNDEVIPADKVTSVEDAVTHARRIAERKQVKRWRWMGNAGDAFQAVDIANRSGCKAGEVVFSAKPDPLVAVWLFL